MTNEELFTGYYLSAFPAVASFIKSSGGTLDEARDVFQDAIIALHEKRLKADWEEEIQDDTAYLIGIARNMWYKRLNRESKASKVTLNTLDSNLADATEMRVSEHIYDYLEKVGKKCMELLKGYYYDRLSMKDIAGKFGFSGERSATVQKHKCLQKVRNEIQTRSLKKEDFYE